MQCHRVLTNYIDSTKTYTPFTTAYLQIISLHASPFPVLLTFK